ncbi:MAG: hypothetical protein AABZ55_00480 [Bdellovibrionota bacterium]
MWQSSKNKGKSSIKRRTAGRGRRTLHLKRVIGEVKLTGTTQPPQIHKVRIILNDFTPKGLGLFCSSPLMVGQDIAITLEHPKRMYVCGRITWCQEHDPDSHVMSNNPFPYRAGVLFVFNNAEEETAVKAFCKDLTEEFLSSAISISA